MPVNVASYTVSGLITLSGGGALAGVTVTLQGEGIERNATTNVNGEYSFANVAPGEYSVTPQSKEYSFAPSSRAGAVTNVDVSGVDFIGQRR